MFHDGRDRSERTGGRGWTVLVALLAVIGAVVLSSLFVGPAAGQSTTANNSTGAEAGTAAANTSASVTLSNQSTTAADRTLVVDRVTLPEGGFVVLHGSRYVFDRVPDPLVASAYLPPGTHEDVRIALPATDRARTNTDGWVAAVAYRDDGDQTLTLDRSAGDNPYTQDGAQVADTAYVDVPAGTPAAADGPPSTTHTATPAADETPAGETPTTDRPFGIWGDVAFVVIGLLALGVIILPVVALILTLRGDG